MLAIHLALSLSHQLEKLLDNLSPGLRLRVSDLVTAFAFTLSMMYEAQILLEPLNQPVAVLKGVRSITPYYT